MQYTFIFIGKSGSGKGTQVALLKKYFAETDPHTPLMGMETGALFREYFSSGNYSSSLSKKINDRGGLQPEFITVNMWSTYLMKNMVPVCHLFVDGTPRKYHEAGAFDSAVKFYGRAKPHVIYLDVEHGTATDRLLKRARFDDTHENIKNRLGWFETDVMSCVRYYEKNPDYHFLKINGDQSIEDVHKEILRAIGLTPNGDN